MIFWPRKRPYLLRHTSAAVVFASLNIELRDDCRSECIFLHNNAILNLFIIKRIHMITSVQQFTLFIKRTDCEVQLIKLHFFYIWVCTKKMDRVTAMNRGNKLATTRSRRRIKNIRPSGSCGLKFIPNQSEKRVSERVLPRIMHIIRLFLRDSWWDFWRDSWQDFSRSRRVSPRVSDWIICMSLGKTLSETRFSTRLVYSIHVIKPTALLHPSIFA